MSPFWPFHIHLHLPNHHHYDDHGDDPKRKEQIHQLDDDTETEQSSEPISLSSSPDVSERSMTPCLVVASSEDESHEHDRRRPKRHRKSVSFCPQATQFEHIHISDYTREEKDDTWYNKSDLHRIQDENHKTIRWMMHVHNRDATGQQLNSVLTRDLCCRGLENKTPTGIKMRMRRMHDALEQTLKYQYHQWDHGCEVCPIHLGEVYHRYAQQSLHLARLAAQRDGDYVCKNVRSCTITETPNCMDVVVDGNDVVNKPSATASPSRHTHHKVDTATPMSPPAAAAC